MVAGADAPLFVEVDPECHQRAGFSVLAERGEQCDFLLQCEFSDFQPSRRDHRVERQNDNY
jgi:hypothetical protein